MIVYADILIILNWIVNYYILLLCSKLNNSQYKNVRMIIAALVGAFFALYIFLPQMSLFSEILIKIISSAVIVLISFGFKNIKNFFRNLFFMFVSAFLYAGSMLAIWNIYKPKNMAINNSVVYFDISPIFLIIFSVLFYLVITLLNSLLKRRSISAKRCNISVLLNDSTANFEGIFDTGNSVRDLFTNSEIIFVSPKIIKLLTGSCELFDNPEYKSRIRLIPCGTVTGRKLINSIRCDRAVVKNSDVEIRLENPILAVSENIDSDSYDALLNPEILLKAE